MPASLTGSGVWRQAGEKGHAYQVPDVCQAFRSIFHLSPSIACDETGFIPALRDSGKVTMPIKKRKSQERKKIFFSLFYF